MTKRQILTTVTKYKIRLKINICILYYYDFILCGLMFILYIYYNPLYIDRSPTSTVVTDEKTVLISDHYNNRISEYSLDDGRFIRHVLTDKEGMYRPECISLQGELLWMSGDNNIRCYKLYTD